MRRSISRLLLPALLALPLVAFALPPHDPRPGGIAVVDLGPRASRPSASFGDKPVMTVEQDGRWYAVVGIPLGAATGSAELVVAGEAGPRIFDVEAHRYREQHLTVAPSYVNPGAEALERIRRERSRIGAAIAQFSASPPAGFVLQPPAPGARSDSFGSRRFFNNEPRSPHRGMDISGQRGTPVVAPLAGTVIERDDFYFTGNAVFVDHGQGLVTLYAHLDSIDVEAGQCVAAGQRLGSIGSTGRVTGPHLHFATYLNGTAVDPRLLLLPLAAD